MVFDVYREISIKNTERANRGADIGIQFRNIAPGHSIQRWRKLLCSSSNKASLIKFLVNTWKQPLQREKLQKKVLYVTCEQECFKISKDQWEDIVELKSSQEEADTRMLLHALHAGKSGYKAVVINAEDTEVLILCLGFSKDTSCPIYQKCGTQNQTRFLVMVHSLGDSVCDVLFGVHAYTGCDTVSAFAGHGKMGALKLMKSEKTYQEAFSELGRSWNVSPDLFEKLQEITRHMYVTATHTSEVNKLRYQMFCARRGELESSQFPSCEDCLTMHALLPITRLPSGGSVCKAIPLYQVLRAMDGQQKDDQLVIEWMRGSPAPEAVLQLLSCKCLRVCKLSQCTSLSNGLKCTEMCKLKTCNNQADEEEAAIEMTDSDADADDEEGL